VTVTVSQRKRLVATVPLRQDELAIRRERKRAGQLAPSQIQRLLVAHELRKKATQGERDE